MARGNINLAPYSFFNAFCYHPPIIGFSSTNWKDSAGNIQDTGEFVWNLATMDLAKQMNATAAHVARDVDEFKIAGLTAAPCKLVNVPRVAESPVAFECKLTQIIQLQGANGDKAQAWLTLGEVVAVHIDKAFIQDGVYQTGLAHPIVRAGRRGDYFEIKPENMFEMIRPDRALYVLARRAVPATDGAPRVTIPTERPPFSGGLSFLRVSHSATASPEPPSSAGKSLSLGRPSCMRRTVSA